MGFLLPNNITTLLKIGLLSSIKTVTRERFTVSQNSASIISVRVLCPVHIKEEVTEGH